MHRKHRIPRLVFDRGKRYKHNECITRSGIQSNIHHSKISSYSIPIGCSVALLLLGFTFINPIRYIISDQDVYADENDGVSTYSYNPSNPSSISMTITGAADQTTNAETGKVASRTNGVTVNATNVDGYQMFVQASSGSSATLTNGTTTISGVGSNVAYASIPDNKWGYALQKGSLSTAASTMSYSTVPESGSTIQAAYATTDDNSATGGDLFTLAFAAKFGNSATAGEYKTNVTLSVAAGAKETTTGVGFAGYTYMQDITKAKCSSSSIANGTEGRLIDKRDNKVYWVAKLKDGLCWMTQNLDYDGGSVSGYSGGDVVDLEAMQPTLGFDDSTQNTKLYYNPGEYIYTKGLATSACGPSLKNGLGDCVDHGWINMGELVSTWTPTDDVYFVATSTYVSTDGNFLCNKDAGSWIGNSDYEQCKIYYYAAHAHYLVGNYYNWYGATNGSTVTSTSNVDTSICPTGWKMPISGDDNNGNDGSYYKIANGVTPRLFAVSPYYFMYGGNILNSSWLSVGEEGRYWSSTAQSSIYAFLLLFKESAIYPSAGSLKRQAGMSVRCVAR